MRLVPAVPLLFVLGASAGLAAQAPPAADQPRQAGTEVPVPKRTRFVPPTYPPAAAARGLRGIVILELIIDTSGKVASVHLVRSVPEFDEAALAAAQQWEYEVTRVDGRPVPVRLTVPITFAMKLPEMRSAAGIPPLRQGAAPAFPSGAAGGPGGSVLAHVTLEGDGRLIEAAIESGASPFTDALLAALRTWRFAPVEGGGHVLSFAVRADFRTKGPGAPRVDLSLSAPRLQAAASPPAADAPPAASAPPLEPPVAAGPQPTAEDPVSPSPAPASPAPPSPPAPAVPADAAPAPTAAATPTVPAGAPPAATPTAPLPAGPAAAAAPPPVEVIPAAPPPPEEGVSAIRDVTLGPGVPDLAKGRRPVVPPLARIQGVSGQVEVSFLVEGSGQTVVRNVSGPELLREAARQTVSSWSFRRSRTDRLTLKAVFAYGAESVLATVSAEL